MNESLKDLRIKKRYNQKEFAKAIGITRQYLWGIEQGKYKPSLEVMMAIANVLNISMTTILKLFK